MKAASANLAIQLTVRDLQSRFSGSALGVFWIVTSPIAQLGVYAFVFGQLLRVQPVDIGTHSYLLFVALGLWPWLMFADGITRGMTALRQNADLLRKTAFPRILLVQAAVNSTILLHLVGYFAVLALLSLFGLPVALDRLVVVGVLLGVIYILTLSLAACLSVIHVLLRDIEQVVGPVLMMLYFLTPVLYPMSMVPEEFRAYIQSNPLATVIGMLRAAWLGTPLDLHSAVLPAIQVSIIAVTGCWIFLRLAPHVDDYA